MTNGGWIKLHRKMLEWEWFHDIPAYRLFTYLLLAANYEDQKWRGRTIGRGQVLTTMARLASATGLSAQQLRTAITKLKSTNEITSKSTNNFTIITICEYGTYQSEEGRSNKPINKPSNNPSTNEQQTNIKKEKKEKNTVGRFTPPTQTDWLAYAKSRNPQWPDKDILNAFDHYEAKGWMIGKNKMKDWKASCRTCQRNFEERNPKQKQMTEQEKLEWLITD